MLDLIKLTVTGQFYPIMQNSNYSITWERQCFTPFRPSLPMWQRDGVGTNWVTRVSRSADQRQRVQIRSDFSTFMAQFLPTITRNLLAEGYEPLSMMWEQTDNNFTYILLYSSFSSENVESFFEWGQGHFRNFLRYGGR